jgi:hypothetical protein
MNAAIDAELDQDVELGKSKLIFDEDLPLKC